MTKKELRKIYRNKRMELSPTEKVKLDDLLLIQFQRLHLPVVHSLFAYWPIGQFNEPNTHLFCGFLEFRNPGLITAYPRIDVERGLMQAVIVHEETKFVKKAFSVFEPEGNEILQPENIDLILVPLLCFDKNGFRVGYGKGFYDRFLAKCRKGCLKIGFSFFDPVDELPDKHEFDVPLNLCVTPHTTYVF